jgi:hypothetical protein
VNAIAKDMGLTSTAIFKWVAADPSRSARVYEARSLSAFRYAEKALEAVESIGDNATPGAIARQREIASHMRWESKIRAPKVFGDKVQVDSQVTVTTDPLQLEDKLRSLLGSVGSLAIDAHTIDVTPEPVALLDSSPDLPTESAGS